MNSKIRINTLISALLVFLVFQTCSQEDELTTTYPRVVTNDNVLVSNTGAVFSAEINSLGSSPITDHGFEWRSIEQGMIDMVSLGSFQGNRFFQAEINRGLELNENYEVRAYVKTAEFNVYGEWTNFCCAGSLVPQLESFAPKEGAWEDTLTVKGSNFSFNPAIVSVEFSGAKGRLITTTDTLIRVVVPYDFVKAAETTIKVVVGSKFVNSTEVFKLRSPEIIQSVPDIGGSGTEIVLKGKYFNPVNSLVKFGEIVIPIKNGFTDKLQLILPKEVVAGDVDITVVSGPFLVTLPKGFTRAYPKILEVIPDHGFYGDTIVLKGENFGALFSDNSVWTDPMINSVHIVDSGPNELKVVIPTVYASQFKFNVGADYVRHVSNVNFKIDSPEITSVSPMNLIYPGQTIVVKGKKFFPEAYGYHADPSLNFCSVKVENAPATIKSASTTELTLEMPVTPTNYSTLSIANFNSDPVQPTGQLITPIRNSGKLPGGYRWQSASFAIGEKAYVTSGKIVGQDTDRQVFMFNQSDQTWTQMQDFPGIARYGATAFSTGGKGYLMGGYTSQGTPLNDIWEYDPLIDTWAKKKDYLFHPVEAFNLNGEIYRTSDITYGVTPPSTTINVFGYVSGFWKYDLSTDSWIKKANTSYNFNRENPNYFTMQVNGILYAGFGTAINNFQIYRYENANDEWRSLGFTNFSSYSPFAFEYNNYGLVMTDSGLYKYTPDSNSWEVLASKLQYTWLGGEPIKFKIGNKTFFGLFRYNQYNFTSGDALRNIILEFNGEYSGL